jgi:hypothetical protein
MKKKEARPGSPPVVHVEAAPTLRIPRYYVILFWTQGSLCNILARNLMRYCICLSYCCYTCDLNILGTRIQASVSSSSTPRKVKDEEWDFISSLRH